MKPTELKNRREGRQAQVKNQRQTIAAVLAAVLVVFIIYRIGILRSVGFAPASSGAASSVSQPSSAASKTKALDQPKLSLQYPGSWTELSQAELSAFKGEFSAGIKRSKPPALMGVKIKAVKGDESSLKRLPDILDKMLSTTFKNFKRVDASARVIDGHQVLRYIYDFDSAAGQRIEQQQYIIVKDAGAYYLVFHLRAADSPILAKEINSIVSSIKLK